MGLKARFISPRRKLKDKEGQLKHRKEGERNNVVHGWKI